MVSRSASCLSAHLLISDFVPVEWLCVRHQQVVCIRCSGTLTAAWLSRCARTVARAGTMSAVHNMHIGQHIEA